MKILSIETSCDETAVSLLSINNGSVEVLGDSLHSQIEAHKEFGGVFPMLAKREHQKNLVPLLLKTLREGHSLQIEGTKISPEKISELEKILERETDLKDIFLKEVTSISKPDIDMIAVTKGPGLEPALWVGISFAKALGVLWDIPVKGINHMEGHIAAEFIDKESKDGSKYKLEEIQFPALALLVSGGHTELVLINKIGEYEIVGKTKDDAVGEAFDKVARILGLPYPGGPQISKLAAEFRQKNTSADTSPYTLPRPMIHSKDFDFSFSGIKTAVLYMTQKIGDLTEDIKMEIAKEFEDACIEVLIYKTRSVIQKYGIQTLIVGGGVSANSYLRENLAKLKEEENLSLYIPDKKLATDNAVMIGLAAYFDIKDEAKIEGDEVIKAEGQLNL